MSEPERDTPPHHDARVRLIWEAAAFQLKLAVEGLRDLLLIPASIAAVIVGLIAGGEEPDVYFRRVQRFGRRTDAWLNVFGHNRRGPSADRFVQPLQDKLLQQTRRGGRLGRGAGQLNQALDKINSKSTRSEDQSG